MESPFSVEVYDKAFTRKGFANDPRALSVTVRHNLPGTAQLTYRDNHHRAADLATPGARVVIKYQGSHLLSGMVRMVTGSGPQGNVTFNVVDDFRLLQRVLGWPVPAAALNAQTVAYDVRTGTAEQVVKGVVSANATRLGLPVTVATNLGRGATVTWQWRFHPLLDRMALTPAGIGVTVKQAGAGLVVDCYEPATYPRTLSNQGGAVTSWTYTLAPFDVSRVVAGNQGEATARVFRSAADTAREAVWGDKVEVFLDARDTTNTAETDQRMAELLTEGAAKAGLSVTLAETAVFKYDPTGTKGVRVGDVITMQVGSLDPITDVLHEAQLSWAADTGLKVRPVVGDRTDDPNTSLVRAVAKAFRQIRNLGAQR